ncbi:hypothetical protein OE88DRAFT_1090152 [Heliocybe sulcata]|uniref:F-box domain-containing protein n=1 Tax=Heliocybe sulcata TaxID=5364 RepID=A0A5C3MNV6_9AGAM|nr:hypothetical protein OE88DRAFT_1090152 [Heliocybe sulcata]
MIHIIGVYELGLTFLPFILVQVCTRWRLCALAYPKLWSTVALACCRRPSDLRKLSGPSRYPISPNTCPGAWLVRSMFLYQSLSQPTIRPNPSPKIASRNGGSACPAARCSLSRDASGHCSRFAGCPSSYLSSHGCRLRSTSPWTERVPSISDRMRIEWGNVTHLTLLKCMLLDFSCAAFLHGCQFLRSLSSPAYFPCWIALDVNWNGWSLRKAACYMMPHNSKLCSRCCLPSCISAFPDGSRPGL